MVLRKRGYSYTCLPEYTHFSQMVFKIFYTLNELKITINMMSIITSLLSKLHTLSDLNFITNLRKAYHSDKRELKVTKVHKWKHLYLILC